MRPLSYKIKMLSIRKGIPIIPGSRNLSFAPVTNCGSLIREREPVCHVNMTGIADCG